MLMTVYTLNKDAKEIWCIRVWTVRARLGISGKSGYSGKKSGLSGLSQHQ
jgi:hypothetical protein